MDQKNLDDLLSEYRAQPTPSLPGSFSKDVLREIRLCQTQPQVHWLADFFSVCLRPTALVASLSIALAVGVSLPMMTRAPDLMLAARSLDLEVFSSHTSGVPSALLSRIP